METIGTKSFYLANNFIKKLAGLLRGAIFQPHLVTLPLTRRRLDCVAIANRDAPGHDSKGIEVSVQDLLHPAGRFQVAARVHTLDTFV